MKILITGGSGFLGINLTRFLLERGHSVRIFDIVDFDYPEKNRADVETITGPVVGDIRNKQALMEAMSGGAGTGSVLGTSGGSVDMVVHTAAALPLYKKEDILSTDIDGTKNVLESAKDAGIKRVVHISSTAVYGIPDHHPLFENDKLVGVGPYGQAKVDAEKICEEYRCAGMIAPVIRPKSFIGPERLGVFALFYDWALTGHNFPMIGSGRNRYQLLDVLDLCDAIYKVLTLPTDKVNDTFNIGAEEFKTMKEDYQAVLDEAGFGKKIIGFPAWPAVTLLRILEALHISPLYKWVYETAHKDSFVSIDKAKQKLGWKPKYSNQQALLRNFAWYKANIDKFKGSSGVSHRVPWKQGILGVLKFFF